VHGECRPAHGKQPVYTPKDFDLNRVMSDVLYIVERSRSG
jgi:hypothetical protein